MSHPVLSCSCCTHKSTTPLHAYFAHGSVVDGCSTSMQGSMTRPHRWSTRSTSSTTMVVRWKLTRLSLTSCLQGWSISRMKWCRRDSVPSRQRKSSTRALWNRSRPQAAPRNRQHGNGIKAVLKEGSDWKKSKPVEGVNISVKDW